MQTAILTLHVIVCVVLVILVLLQAGREGMGVIFGGGGNSSVFGSAGAGGILVKLTTVLAVLFIATSLFYNIMTSTGHDKGSSILDVRFGDEVMPPPAPVTTAPAGTEAAPQAGAPQADATQASEPSTPESPAGAAVTPGSEAAAPVPDEAETAPVSEAPKNESGSTS